MERRPVVVRAPSELDVHNGAILTEALLDVPADAALTIDCRDVEFADSMACVA